LVEKRSIFENREVRRQAFFLLKKVNKAIRDYGLIQDGDKIAVAVSGGKDSLTLLCLLGWRRRFVPEKYELVAINIQTEYRCTSGASKEELEAFLQQEGFPCVFERISLRDASRYPDDSLNCFWCSWNRRKALFLTAHRLGCNKVAFGHHADDAAQTVLLNLFYHGRLERMEPRVDFFDGKITVIRPLIYVPEKEIIRFSRVAAFPVQAHRCPNSRTSRRSLMKEIIRLVEQDCPEVKTNLFRAVERLGKNEGQKV